MILDVTTNHLTETNPRDLCKGGMLDSLIMMDNFFSRPIPEELGNCNSLTKCQLLSIIELDDNLLSGVLPVPEKMSGAFT